MLRVKYPVIVEGRYDKAKLSSLIAGDIITTEGFGIFSDKEKLALIRRLAAQDKVVLLTDSDRAGFRIRGYLAGAIPAAQLVHIYIPELAGKEPRKQKPSAEGTLGVEGIPAARLRTLLAQAGVLEDEQAPVARPCITKQQLYTLGLTGQPQSAQLRRRLQQQLGLPAKLSSNALCGVLARVTSYPALVCLVAQLRENQTDSLGDQPAHGCPCIKE